MSLATALHSFAAFGIELEYMVVDRQTLGVLPIADECLRRLQSEAAAAPASPGLAWSNELVLHVLELKNPLPAPGLEGMAAVFQAEVERANRAMAPLGARLMPTAMHPWMNPRVETRLWPHDQAPVYVAYDRIFDCRRHGFANLQSMHVNLPFAGDEEFARLHAAIRLVLPILPALAASSPFAEDRPTGMMDSRMEAYLRHMARIPSTGGRIIPDTILSRAEYESRILAPMYRDMAPFDPQGVLRHEWLNCRGVIPRFDRNALEIRVIDVQECPHADLAIAAAAARAVRALYDAPAHAPLEKQQAISTRALVRLLLACIRDADQAQIGDAEYLRLLGFPGRRCEARELWSHLCRQASTIEPGGAPGLEDPLRLILDQGPLARRILRAAGTDTARPHLLAIYGELCRCLDEGRMFVGLT